MASIGSISLKDTAPVNDGDILTLIVDLTEGATKGVIKVHPGKASSAVTTVNETATTADNIWYDLCGRRLPGKPTTPGFYINSNNKVLVK